MQRLNLESDVEHRIPPTPKGNWIAAGICVLLTLYIVAPWEARSPAGLVGKLIAVVIVLTIPVIASVFVERYTVLRPVWGVIFVTGWIVGEVLLVMLASALFHYSSR